MDSAFCCFVTCFHVSDVIVDSGTCTRADCEQSNTRSKIESQFFLSIFLLAYAVGPSVLGSLSETYGRVRVLQIANLLYLMFNLACGLSKTTAQMLVFRFLSGIGGSAPLSIGGGVIGDLFQAHERGYAVSVYSLAPLLGPAIG
jgi:MFS family permease